MQDFNNLAATGTHNSALPNGFAFVETGGDGDNTFAASNGSLSAGNTYSFGSDSERALGEVTTETVQSIFGACFVNNTGYAISRFAVGFTVEQWRLGAADGVSDGLNFQYSTDATDLTNGTWVNVFSYVSRVNDGPVGSLNGNGYQTIFIPGIRTLATAIPMDGLLFVRWVSIDISGEDDGLAIDHFNLRTFPSADFDKDSDVDGADFLAWQRRLGSVDPTVYGVGDATGDGRVTASDLTVWERQFARSLAVTTAVPEPSTSYALVITAMFLTVIKISGRK